MACIQMVEVGVIKYNMRKEMQMAQKRQEEEVERQKGGGGDENGLGGKPRSRPGHELRLIGITDL